MKVYWWPAGLHFAPESQEEKVALLTVDRSLKYVEPTNDVPTGQVAVSQTDDQKPIVIVD